MFIGAGSLDRRITLRRKTVTNTGLGTTEAWADLGTIWAGRRDVSDGEKAAAGTMQSIVAARFVVRSSSLTRTLTPKDALIEGGRTFEITGIKELGRRDFLEITAEARTDL